MENLFSTESVPASRPKAGGIARSLPWLASALRILLGLVFLAAALSKLLDVSSFADQISAYHLIRDAWDRPMAHFLIISETLLALALITGLWPRITLAMTAGALVLFIGALAWGMAHGSLVNCGCFGDAVQRSPAQAVAEDAVLLALTACAWLVAWRAPFPVSFARIGAFAALAAIALFVLGPDNSVSYNPDNFGLPTYNVGKRVETLATSHGALPVGHGNWLIAFLSVTCPHCQAAIPGLNVLSKMRSMPSLLGVVFTNPQDPNTLRKGFHPTFKVVYVPQKKLPVLITRRPDILLLKNGLVQNEWYHVPTPQQVLKGANTPAGRPT